ncbi:MAG: hypothetical protein Q9196_000152 [Gyalolechia fulgens]
MTTPQSAQNTSPTVSPTPWLYRLPEFYYPQKNTNGSECNSIGHLSDKSTSISLPLGWRPFHVFNTRPQAYFLGERKTSIDPNAPSEKGIIARQKELFHEIQDICTNAARKFWRTQSPSASSLPLISHRTASSLSQRSHQDVGNLASGKQQSCETGQDNPLMEYIQRINDILLRRARAISGDHETVMAECLPRIMQMLTWAEQVRNLAERGGYGMSDDGIEEAVKGARDLTCWLLDLEGEVALEKLWQGKWIDGGLVFCDEDLVTL